MFLPVFWMLDMDDSRISVKLEVFTAVTAKNAVFWGTKNQLVPRRRYITSSLQSPVG
jgi:hypothetical protein